MSALPAILEYGLTGLAAIIVFLAYRLLQQESETEAPRPAMLQTIKAFMALGVVLAVVSAASNYIELRSASGAQLAAVRDSLASARDSLQTVRQTTAAERRALNRLVANHLASHLRRGEDKVAAVPASARDTVRCTLLRRAVFQNMRTFEADAGILQHALTHFVEDRGYPELRACAQELTRDVPHLAAMRLKWLEGEAMPALRAAQDQQPPFVQQEPSATVFLPEAFVIDRTDFERPTVTVTDMTTLQAEVRLLEEALQQ
jgi:hypothetical protein